MGKFRKKPIIVEAIQWNGRTVGDAYKFCAENNLPQFNVGSIDGKAGLIIPTLEGNMVASRGDWIIKGVNGEYYPCKPDIFEKTYEDAEDRHTKFCFPWERAQATLSLNPGDEQVEKDKQKLLVWLYDMHTTVEGVIAIPKEDWETFKKKVAETYGGQ